MSETNKKEICGIIMPISTIDGCNEAHWADVLEILAESIEGAGFESNLVSNADEVGIIHKRIIQNLYENPIVVCDVSGKNPNVMFELGLRLAFDKPTIIVKDDKTSYSFDTSAIEHLEYPRDLRFSKIVDFKQRLTSKIIATNKKASNDENYTTFLKHFGEFKVAKLDQKEISGQEYIIEELRGLRYSMRRLERNNVGKRSFDSDYREKSKEADINICMEGWIDERIEEVVHKVSNHPEILWFDIFEKSEDHKHLIIKCKPDANISDIKRRLEGKKTMVRTKYPDIVKKI